MCATSVPFMCIHAPINILKCIGYRREHNCFNTKPNRLHGGLPQRCRNTHLHHILDCRVLVNQGTKRNEKEAAPTIIANLRILARACDSTATSGSFVSSSAVNPRRACAARVTVLGVAAALGHVRTC